MTALALQSPATQVDRLEVCWECEIAARQWVLLKETGRKGGVDPESKKDGLHSSMCFCIMQITQSGFLLSSEFSISQKKQTKYSLLWVLRVWSNEPKPVKRKSNLFWEATVPLTLRTPPTMTSERWNYQFPFWNSLLELSGAKIFENNCQLFRSSTFPNVTQRLWVSEPQQTLIPLSSPQWCSKVSQNTVSQDRCQQVALWGDPEQNIIIREVVKVNTWPTSWKRALR